MNCPKCQAPMRSYERSGITVDQCSECRGIYLDRGELEKLIDAEASAYGADDRRDEPRREPPRDQYRDHDRGHGQHGGHYGKRKKRGFLSEILDFD